MRDPKYILEHFPLHKLKSYEEIFISDKFSIDDKLMAAMELLNIDLVKFKNIPFLADKKSLLKYKYHATHFELCSTKYDKEHKEFLNLFKKLAKIAMDKISMHSVMTAHRNKLSSFSQGLSTLYQRTGLYDMSKMSENDIDASIITVGNKPGGIEPGFMAAHHQDVVTWLADNFDGDEESLITLIEVNHGDFDQIFELIKDSLPKYLYKLDYKTNSISLPESPGATPVYLTAEDVKRTSNVKKAYAYGGVILREIVTGLYVIAKNSTALEINKEAILETLSNDFASLFMRVQQQKLFITSYKNGAVKFMPQAAWVEGSELFGSDERMLVGSDKDIYNYLGQSLLMVRNGIATISDTNVLNLSRHLIPLLCTGDYDKIGSKGQNLLVVASPEDMMTGRKQYEIVGIDFGHTFRKDNSLIINNCITPDARFSRPAHHDTNPFKNYTALMDGTLCEKMQGAHILAKLRGFKIDESIIASYGKDFNQYYNNIPPGEANILCDNYMAAIRELQEVDYNNWIEYNAYIKTIEEFKQRMNSDLDAFVSMFKNYLYYPAPVVELADNLNKLCASALGKTGLRSENGKHGLNHLRIRDDYHKTWDVEFSNNQYILSCPFDRDQLPVIANCFNDKKSSNFLMVTHDGRVSIRFHEQHLNEMVDLFNENSIKYKYHKDDFEIIESGYNEIKLRNLINAPWFRKNNIGIALSLNPHNHKQYRIQLHVKSDTDTSDVLSAIIENAFNLPLVNNDLTVDFGPNQLNDIINKLELLQINYTDIYYVEFESKMIQKEMISDLISQSYINIEKNKPVMHEEENLSGADKVHEPAVDKEVYPVDLMVMKEIVIDSSPSDAEMKLDVQNEVFSVDLITQKQNETEQYSADMIIQHDVENEKCSTDLLDQQDVGTEKCSTDLINQQDVDTEKLSIDSDKKQAIELSLSSNDVELKNEDQAIVGVGPGIPQTLFYRDLPHETEEVSMEETLKTNAILFNIQKNTMENFRKVLGELVKAYETAAYAEISTANSAVSLLYGSFYYVGKNVVNSVWGATANSSATLLPHLKKYLATDNPVNTEEISALLIKRMDYVNASLLSTAPDKYSIEIKNLDFAISCAKLLDDTKSFDAKSCSYSSGY